jgi:hypothetical protein
MKWGDLAVERRVTKRRVGDPTATVAVGGFCYTVHVDYRCLLSRGRAPSGREDDIIQGLGRPGMAQGKRGRDCGWCHLWQQVTRQVRMVTSSRDGGV